MTEVATDTAESLRDKAEGMRRLARGIAPPYGTSVRASLAAKAYRDQADILDRRADELEKSGRK